MHTLRETMRKVSEDNIAIGHFNISDTVALRAIFETAKEIGAPVIIGTSEGERKFLGVHESVALVRTIREKYDYPIFLNADHTHDFQKIKEAVDAGYDAVLFDPVAGAREAGKTLSFEDHVVETKRAVEYAKSRNPDILVEGELGYIGSSSSVFEALPEGAAIKEEDLTKPEEAAQFVKETGVDLLAPAVGNIHGMLVRRSPKGEGGFENAGNPDLNIHRIREIREAAGVPLVLHGGSGIKDGDFIEAIKAGVSIIHINTEIRSAWRKGLESKLKEKPNEVAPYKLLAGSLDEMKKVIYNRLTLFSGKS